MTAISMRKRRLQGFQATGETYSQLDLADLSAYGSKWIDCVFDRCDMTLSDFSGAYFEKCRFLECDLQGSSFRAAQIRESGFAKCNLRRGMFTGVSPMVDTTFDDCDMRLSNFFEATMFRNVILNCNMHGADLRFIEADGNDFTGTNLWGVAVQIGCQFFRSTFDERSAGIFVAIASRLHPNPETAKILRGLAGKEYALAAKLMDARGDAVEKKE